MRVSVSVSARVSGLGHWFNRIERQGRHLDVDLSGDQWNRPPVQIGDAGSLYDGARERLPTDLTPETVARAVVLAERAGLQEIADRLRQWPKRPR